VKRDEARLPQRFLADLDETERQRLEWTFATAGFSLVHRNDSPWMVGQKPGPKMVVLESIQKNNGQFRGDTGRLLTGPLGSADVAENARAVADHLDQLKVQGYPTNLIAAMVRFWAEPDPMTVINWLNEQYEGLRFYRLRATRAWHFAEACWRMALGAVDDDLTFREMKDRGFLPPPDAATGMLPLHSAAMASVPLIARMQPLAAVFMTASAAEVIVLPPGGWARPAWLPSFPVSLGGSMDLAGPGTGVYRTSISTVPDEFGYPLLKSMTTGTNELARWLCSPRNWQDESGLIDPVSRYIAVGTLRIGLGVLAEIGAQWGSSEMIWTAFRGLGALAGLWESRASGDLLRQVLHPSVARQFAISNKLPAPYQQWCHEILDLYETELTRLFPGVALETAVSQLAEIRNLVHGVGALPTRTRDRRARFDAMRRIGEGALVHLLDLTSMWWSALILSPSTHCRPGVPPFPIPVVVRTAT
jgi:hypothetical protein